VLVRSSRSRMGTRRRFSAEFKRDAVELVRTTGKPIAEIARDLGVGESSLGYWVTRDRKLRGEHVDQAPMTDDEREELKRLRKRVAELEMEREILKRATAFWVKESERHEAFLNRAVMKGHRRRVVAAVR